MPNYEHGKIYAIRSHQTDQIYIGSTVERLSARMSKHRASYKMFKKGKGHFTTSFHMLEFDDAFIELIENFPCLCREELDRVEGQHIRSEPTAVNKNVAGRGRVGAQAVYYAKNVDKINEKHTCVCGGRYTHHNKNRHATTKKHIKFLEEAN